MKRRYSVLVLTLVVLGLPAFAKKSMEEHWASVGLKFKTAESLFPKCKREEKLFKACVAGVSAALEHIKDSPALVPASRVAAETGYGAVVKEFGPVVAVGRKKSNTKTLAEHLKRQREERKLSEEALSALYKDLANTPVDFAAIGKWIQEDADFAKNESLITGSLMNGLEEVYHDPHTAFMPAGALEDMASGSESFVGIGAVLQDLAKSKEEKSKIVVERPLEGGPAFKAGVRANDVITHIDGETVDGMKLSEVVTKIKGEEGTEVKLTVLRGEQTLEITVARGKIEVKTVEHKALGEKSEAGYIKLADFMKMKKNALGVATGAVYEDVKAAVDSLKKSPIKGFILDLRGNGGGLLTESVRVSSVFLKNGSLVLFTKNMDDELRGIHRTKQNPLTDLPLIVLVNSGSASASEIVAGALQDHQRGFIVGERTFGKGTVQQMEQMTENLIYKHTIERFFRPSGQTNQIEGILPDVEVYSTPNPTDEEKVSLREEDLYASLPKIGQPWAQPRPAEVKKLGDCVAKGDAKASFESEKTMAAIPPDYQLLVAQDALNCVISENLWDASAPGPALKAPERKRTVMEKLFRSMLPLVPLD